MRCDICDSLLVDPVFNTDLDDWEPCGTCLAVINDAVGNFSDRPSVDEDELGDETSLHLSSDWLPDTPEDYE